MKSRTGRPIQSSAITAFWQNVLLDGRVISLARKHRKDVGIPIKGFETTDEFDAWRESMKLKHGTDSVRVEFATNAKNRFDNGSMEVKKDIFRALGSNLSLKDRILSLDLMKPLTLIERIAPEANAVSKMFEPTEKPDKQGFIRPSYAQNPNLLRG